MRDDLPAEISVLAYYRQSDEEGHKRELSIPMQEGTCKSWVDGI